MRRPYSTKWMLASGLAVVAAGAFLAWMFVGGGKTGDGAKAVLDVVSNAADLEVKNFRYSQVGDPDFQWEVTADRAWYMKRNEEVHLEHVAVRLVSKAGRVYHMIGDRGVLDNGTGDMEITGSVVVDSDRGERLETETLRYRAAEKKVLTDGSVKMYRENMRLSGKGMTFTLEKNEMVLSSNVKAVISNVSLFY